MTGVYEHALGGATPALHPKVRERYSIGADDNALCVGQGTMDLSHGTLALPALYAMTIEDLLFPEAGENIPFTVTTYGYRSTKGHEVLLTKREFDFGSTTRRFDSRTVWDDDNDRLLDFLGANGRIVSELQPRVKDGALVVGGGRQWIRVGRKYIPLPDPLTAGVGVRDRYDDSEERYHVTAVVKNRLVGDILSYRGTFTQYVEDVESMPADLQIDRELPPLPPK